MLLMLIWAIKHIGYSSTMTFGRNKIIFPCNFHDIDYASFSLHCYYVYNFQNHYWILNIQYQFTIIVCEILLNITHTKKGQIVSPKLNGDICMRLFNSITVCYVQYICIQNIWIEII